MQQLLRDLSDEHCIIELCGYLKGSFKGDSRFNSDGKLSYFKIGLDCNLPRCAVPFLILALEVG